MSKDDTINVYGAGGCGINLASKFSNFVPTNGYAAIKTVYLDVGEGNFPKEASDDQCRTLADEDGSGKIRSQNASVIAERIPDVLNTHVPATFNVIIFSAGGGSGSVIGPLLARELSRKDAPYVVILIGDNESHTSAKNTYKTYMTLENISQSTNLPISMSWHKNSAETPRTVVDKSVHDEVLKIAKLASGQNRDLDSRDLANWVYYTRPNPELIPQLSLLTITTDASAVSQINNPLSVAHLLKGENSLPKDFSPQYSCPGYLPDGDESSDSEILFVISVEEIEDISRSILNDFEKFEELAKVRSKLNPTLIKESDKATDDGLIL